MASTLDYVLILGVAIACVYIIYRMIKKQQASSPSAASPPPYSDTPSAAQMSQLNKIENTKLGSGITSMQIDMSGDYSLRNYCIKSSFNSAYTGSYVNRNMVKYVLSRGCRFLDFEVYVKDGIPIVAYSTAQYDPSFTHFTSKSPAISLDGVCSTIMANAFTETSPNPADPLFVQLRIKTYLQSAYSSIAQTIMSTLSDKLYQGTVTMDTPLPSLMGKIVLIVDKSSSPGYPTAVANACSPGDATCYNLSSLVNMESGGEVVRVYRANDLMNQSINPPDPNVYLMRIVLPTVGFFYGVQNSDAYYLIQNYGAQVVAQVFYINNGALGVYEDLFRNFKSAFVPIPAALQYIEAQNTALGINS